MDEFPDSEDILYVVLDLAFQFQYNSIESFNEFRDNYMSCLLVCKRWKKWCEYLKLRWSLNYYTIDIAKVYDELLPHIFWKNHFKNLCRRFIDNVNIHALRGLIVKIQYYRPRGNKLILDMTFNHGNIHKIYFDEHTFIKHRYYQNRMETHQYDLRITESPNRCLIKEKNHEKRKYKKTNTCVNIIDNNLLNVYRKDDALTRCYYYQTNIIIDRTNYNRVFNRQTQKTSRLSKYVRDHLLNYTNWKILEVPKKGDSYRRLYFYQFDSKPRMILDYHTKTGFIYADPDLVDQYDESIIIDKKSLYKILRSSQNKLEKYQINIDIQFFITFVLTKSV